MMKAIENNDSMMQWLLALDREIYPGDYVDRARAMLDRGRALARDRLEVDASAHSAASVLADIVFRSFGIMFSADGPGDVFSLTSVLNCKRASCLGITLVYVALAEHVDLPVKGVLYDQHIALKYSAADVELNIEPRFSGKILDRIHAQKFYGARFSPPYGLPLSRSGLQAVVLANRAPVALGRLGADEALRDLDSAIDILPSYATAWINKAVIMFESGKARQAGELLERARKLSPGPRTTGLIDEIQERYASS